MGLFKQLSWDILGLKIQDLPQNTMDAAIGHKWNPVHVLQLIMELHTCHENIGGPSSFAVAYGKMIMYFIQNEVETGLGPQRI